jgi:hypothetical protein
LALLQKHSLMGVTSFEVYVSDVDLRKWKTAIYLRIGRRLDWTSIWVLHICKLKDMLSTLNAGLQYLNSEIKMEKYSARSLCPSVVGDCFKHEMAASWSRISKCTWLKYRCIYQWKWT